MKYLQLFYGGSISKNDLMYIIKYLDSNKAGFINYNEIQMFLYNNTNITDIIYDSRKCLMPVV